MYYREYCQKVKFKVWQKHSGKPQLKDKFGVAERARTADLMLHRHAL